MSNGAKRSRWRRNFFLTVLVIGLVVSLAALWTTENYLWRLPTLHGQSPPRALLLDPLALYYPDPTFVANLTDALVNAGYHLDYWGPSSSTVQQFRQLPSGGYNLIIIRSHTGSSQSIITTEPYSRTAYAADQFSGALAPAEAGNSPLYFAITARFVRMDMMGRFSESTIVVMGCSALQGTEDLAAAFLDKGANFFVGWDSAVTMIHTDSSTVALAQQLAKGQSIPQATRTAISADPVYGARLQYLDWNTLVHDRLNTLISNAIIWSILASVLVLGPSTVFLGPKLLDMIGRTRERASHLGKRSLARGTDSTARKES